MFTHMREIGVDVSTEQPLRLCFHFVIRTQEAKYTVSLCG